ncbi:Hypothetical_protein [Hexamita inflata]|uniref:Hypothetical_protein n=1 Tax=Hexamita inflata TaxID=28002 RepID=A0AA86Q5D4_9EUKA|nr:Hypothetical protein HINF_LOCUS40101 [Hexamita inflata]
MKYKKVCAARESDPDLLRGKQAFYHQTSGAYQIYYFRNKQQQQDRKRVIITHICSKEYLEYVQMYHVQLFKFQQFKHNVNTTGNLMDHTSSIHQWTIHHSQSSQQIQIRLGRRIVNNSYQITVLSFQTIQIQTVMQTVNFNRYTAVRVFRLPTSIQCSKCSSLPSRSFNTPPSNQTWLKTQMQDRLSASVHRDTGAGRRAVPGILGRTRLQPQRKPQHPHCLLLPHRAEPLPAQAEESAEKSCYGQKQTQRNLGRSAVQPRFVSKLAARRTGLRQAGVWGAERPELFQCWCTVNQQFHTRFHFKQVTQFVFAYENICINGIFNLCLSLSMKF